MAPPRPALLILDEPTRGIDVGARQEVYRLIDALARQSKTAVLMISSEIEELMGACDRILVMARGRITDEIARPDFDRERILRAALAGGGGGGTADASTGGNEGPGAAGSATAGPDARQRQGQPA